MDNYQKMIHMSRYARHIDGEDRRETWQETHGRYFDYMKQRVPTGHKKKYAALEQSVHELSVMPSMRALMTAGKALTKDHVAGYNCAYLPIEVKKAFDEMMYILMCGTGVGFSVESRYVLQLPTINDDMYESDTTIVVADSKIGWATAFRELISMLYDGKVPKWDMSKIRPKGSPLKTFGGRASGPEPLIDLFKYTVNTIRRFAGQKLPPVAVHDLCCKIAQIVVVGGVRRSALISLSDVSDRFMMNAKAPFHVKDYTLLGHDETGDLRKYSVTVDDAPYGDRSLVLYLNDWESGELQAKNQLGWWHVHPERRLANNSASYGEKPSFETFMGEMVSLYKSFSGERGIFNREASQLQAARHGGRDADHEFGTNPCSEIILRPYEFCNLSEVVVRPDDTVESIAGKVAEATVLGTVQSTLVDFRYLGKRWKKNCEEERLCGVSLTGIMDNPIMAPRTAEGRAELGNHLEDMKARARETNAEWAKILGIPASAAITCVKPSGTVSQLVDASSGIHPRMARHYLRTVRGDVKDPLSEFMDLSGIYSEFDVTDENTKVFYFPIKSPDHSVLASDMGAIEQLELWKVYAEHWCEHKPSQTVYYRDDEFFAVCQWVWQNFDWISGISFLPYNDHVYKQAPYIPIDAEEFKEWDARTPLVDWESFSELEDGTLGTQTLACTAGVCEVADFTAT